MKLDILVFGAHPDDAELGAGATIAKMVALGKEVGIIDLTRGELGTRGTPELRETEARKAAEILGVSVRENLNFPDGFLRNDPGPQMAVIEKIREYKPDIVLANALNDRHIDHGTAARLVSDSCFLAGLRAIDNGLDPWRPKQVFHYIQWRNLKPDFILDVSGEFLETKIKACLAYASQFYDENSTEPQTAISSKNFTESIRYRAYDLGRLIWKDAGEGFQSEEPIGINDLSDFI